MLTAPPGRRAAVVAGLRTPFAKAGTALASATGLDLARHCTRELLYRTELPGDEVDEIVFGQVIPSPLVPNVAREVSLLPQFPRTIPAYTLNRACSSGAQGICNAADQIMAGHADVILAGGTESLSDIPDPPQPQGVGNAHGGRPCQVTRRTHRALLEDPSPRPQAGGPRHRRAEHRRDDGGVGREDGQGESHHPRGAGRVCPDEPPARRRGHRRRTAHRRDRAVVRRSGAWTRFSPATT